MVWDMAVGCTRFVGCDSGVRPVQGQVGAIIPSVSNYSGEFGASDVDLSSGGSASRRRTSGLARASLLANVNSQERKLMRPPQ
jgi:hypothetical protein